MKTKKMKQEEALERQTERDKLTAQQQVQKLDKNNFAATKERKRLSKEIK